MPESVIRPIILNWNNYEDTGRCLHSLNDLEYSNLDPLVIDNGSTDRSAERLAEEFSVEIYETGANLGFAGGLNEVIQEAVGEDVEYLWLLNNDIEFPDRFSIGSLLSEMNRSQVAAVTPLIQDEAGDVWFSSAEIDWRTGGHDIQRIDTSDTVQTDFVPIVATLVNRELFSEVPLPEGYFMYTEDVEWGVQLWDEGHQIVTSGSERVTHFDGNSSAGALKSYYASRNPWIFKCRHREQIESFYLPYFWGMAQLAAGRVIRQEWGALQALSEGIVDGAIGKEGRGRYP